MRLKEKCKTRKQEGRKFRLIKDRSWKFKVGLAIERRNM